MAVGNTWIGTKEYFDASGKSLGVEDDTLMFTKTVDINGEIWFQLNDGYVFINRKDGVWSRLLGSISDESELIFAKYPTVRGDTFRTERLPVVTTSGVDTALLWYRTFSTDASLSTPYGSVTAYTFVSYLQFEPGAQPEPQLESWSFTPGIGLVMRTNGTGPTPEYPTAIRYEWKLREVKLQ